MPGPGLANLAFGALLAGGLCFALAPTPAEPAPPRVIHFRNATPAESLLHDLQRERELRCLASAASCSSTGRY